MTGKDFDVKKSLEYRWRKQILCICGIIALVGVVCTPLLSISIGSGSRIPGRASFRIILSALIISVLPFVIFHGYKMGQLCNRWKDLPAYSVRLEVPTLSYFYKRTLYYQVSFVREDRKRVTTRTSPIFQSGPLAKFKVGDYNNQEVWILYDEEKNRAYLIDKVENVNK